MRPGVLTAYRIASDLTAKAAFLLLTVLAARRLSRDEFGLFALGSAIGWIAGVISDAGLQLHVARTVARSDVGSSGWIIRRWLTWRVTAAFVALGLAAAGVAVWTADSRAVVPLILLIAVWLCNAVTEFLNHLFRGLSRTDVESTVTGVSRIATLGAGAAALAWRPTLMSLAVALLPVAAMTLIVTAQVARRLTIGRVDPIVTTQARRWREFAEQVAPIGAGIVLSALYFRIDVVLLERWQGAAAVGSYTAVFRLIEALRLFPAAALAVALPALCQATTTRPMTRLAIQWSAAALILSAALWMAAGWLIPFTYGRRFADAVPAFRVLLLAFPLMTLNYVLTTQLVAWDRHRAYAVLCGAALIVNVGVNARLIPVLSAAGAAWATLWTEVFLTAGCAWALSGHRLQRLSGLRGVTAS
jgi:O-antigen/teichoic acid export membrane protein